MKWSWVGSIQQEVSLLKYPRTTVGNPTLKKGCQTELGLGKCFWKSTWPSHRDTCQWLFIWAQCWLVPTWGWYPLVLIVKTVSLTGYINLPKVSTMQSQDGVASNLPFLIGKRPGAPQNTVCFTEKSVCLRSRIGWASNCLCFHLTLSEQIEMCARLLFIILSGNYEDSFHYARPNLDKWKGRLSNYRFYICA